MVIPVIGPSHAGKSKTIKRLVVLGLLDSAVHLELDLVLGEPSRSDGHKAVRVVTDLIIEEEKLRAAGVKRHVLVDVGAGQLVSPPFACYLSSFSAYPSSVIVIWCDEETFKIRHGDNAPNEVDRYYGPTSSLNSFWENARLAGRLVDTSVVSVDTAAGHLAEIVREMIATV
jgi:hypothetical protein